MKFFDRRGGIRSAGMLVLFLNKIKKYKTMPVK